MRAREDRGGNPSGRLRLLKRHLAFVFAPGPCVYIRALADPHRVNESRYFPERAAALVEGGSFRLQLETVPGCLALSLRNGDGSH